MSSTTKKALAVLTLIILCFIPTLLVMAIVHDRQIRSDEVREQVGMEWGNKQEFLGPVLVLPYKKAETIDGKITEYDRSLYVFPKTEDLSLLLTPQEKTRGIFRIPVYSADLSGEALFEIPSPSTLAGFGRTFDLAHATLALPLTDVRSIDPKSTVTVDGTAGVLLQGAGVLGEKGGTMQGVHVRVDVSRKKTLSTQFALTVSGNEQFAFVPAGSVTTAKASSSWKTPSFTGAYLPSATDITGEGFEAHWRVSGLGRAFPELVSSDTFSLSEIAASSIAVSLFDGVDQYTLVFRAVKYAILFIVLTFMGFFFVEVLHALRVHPIQYALVGAALGLFYLLLLSLSEQITFGLSYIIAAGLTTLLISSYAYFVLHARRHALIVGGLLAALYTYLYLVLRSEDYALLSGTLLLFAILAATMYITRKVDWYSFDQEKSI